MLSSLCGNSSSNLLPTQCKSGNHCLVQEQVWLLVLADSCSRSYELHSKYQAESAASEKQWSANWSAVTSVCGKYGLLLNYCSQKSNGCTSSCCLQCSTVSGVPDLHRFLRPACISPKSASPAETRVLIPSLQHCQKVWKGPFLWAKTTLGSITDFCPEV